MTSKSTQDDRKYGFYLPPVSKFVQDNTFDLDTTRLVLGNIRRIALTLLAFPDTFGHEWLFLDHLVRTSGPILTLAGFLIYIPRTVDSCISIYHDLSEGKTTLKTYFEQDDGLDEHFFNIINDFPSIIAGFIAVFLLTATTAWLAAYITVAVKFCEVCFSATRANYDVGYLERLREQYKSKIKPTSLERFDNHIRYIRELRTINLIMHSLLLLCLTAFIPPIMLLHPVIPILAIIFAIALISLRYSFSRQLWMTPCTKEDQDLKPLHFFKNIKEVPEEVPEAKAAIDKPEPSCFNQE
ncbi:MAG: hypothetical protein QNK11_07345 [Legionella sp.]|nr:hypothetical protein [Legionella sp.]